MSSNRFLQFCTGMLILTACNMQIDNSANCFDSNSDCFPEDSNSPKLLHSLPAPGIPIKDLPQLELTFSEPVKGAENKSAYEMQVSGTAPVIDSVEHTGGNSYLLTFSNTTDFTSLTFTFSGVTDYSGNPVTDSLTFEPDVTAPSFVESIPADNGMLGESGVLKIVFNEAVNPTYTAFTDSNNNDVSFSVETTYKTSDTIVIAPDSGTWNHGGLYSINVTELKATDNADNAMTNALTFSFTVNRPPSPSLNGSIFHAADGSTAALDATGSSDADGDPLTCTWQETSGTGLSINPSGTGNCLASLSYDFSSEGYDTAVKYATIEVRVSDNVNPAATSSRGVRMYRTDFAYVKAGATGDGSAPDNALGLVYDGSTGAMTYAQNNSKTAVAVSEGKYEQYEGRSGCDPSHCDPDNENNKAVYLQNNIRLLGGYDSSTWARDIASNLTYLQKQDATPTGEDAFGWDNYRVVVCNGVNETAVLDGFIIENQGPYHRFYGIEVINSECTIRNNRITGGGPYTHSASVVSNYHTSTPVYIKGTSMPRLINNTLYLSRITWNMCSENSSACTYKNTKDNNSIALVNSDSSVIAINNTFVSDHIVDTDVNNGTIEVFINNIVKTGGCSFNVNNSYYQNNAFSCASPPAGGVNNLSGVTANLADTTHDPGPNYTLQSSSPCSITQGGRDLSSGLSNPVSIAGFNNDRFENNRTSSDGWSIGANEYDGSCQ